MANWKRILLEDDVAGDGIITVTSSPSALHTVSLGDPDVLPQLSNPVVTDGQEDKFLIWDESGAEWKWISADNFPDTNLGNSNLVQTDATRTFDVANNGVLEFHLNGGGATGNEATRLKLSYDTSSIPSSTTALPRAVIELNTPTNLRQTRAFLISVDEASESAFNDSSFSGSWGIDTLDATYSTSSAGGIVKLDAYSNIAALNDDTEGSETYTWGADKVKYVNIELGSTGLVTPALNWDEVTTSAAHAQQNFGGYINFDVLKPIQASPYYQSNTQLRVDNVGVRINDADTDEDSYYLPTDRGTEGYIMSTDGVSAAKWSNPLEVFLPELMQWVNENSGGSTIYGAGTLNGDFNGDGIVNSSDLLTFLGSFGSTVSNTPPTYSYSGFDVGETDVTTPINYSTSTLNDQTLNIDELGTAVNYTPHQIVINETADFIGFREENGNAYGPAFNPYRIVINSLNVDVTKTAATQDVVYLGFKLQAVYDDNGSDVVADLSNLNTTATWSSFDNNMHHIGGIIESSAGVTSHVMSEISEPMLQLSNYENVTYGLPKEIRIKFYAFRQDASQGEVSVEITGLSLQFIS